MLHGIYSAIKKRYHFYPINAAIFVIALIWAVWIILIPCAFEPGTVDNLDGRANAIDNANRTDSMPILAKIAYVSGDLNCHQKHDRSFYTNGNQQPFCARCTAIFVGMAIGAFICAFIRLDIRWYWLILGLVPMGLDGGIQLFADAGPFPTHYESTNMLRLITGIIAGITTVFGITILTYDIDETREKRANAKKNAGPPYYLGRETASARAIIAADAAKMDGSASAKEVNEKTEKTIEPSPPIGALRAPEHSAQGTELQAAKLGD